MADRREQGLQILQVVQGFPPEIIGGTEHYCQALTRALRERGHRCFVLAGSNQQAREPALVTTDEERISVSRYVSALPQDWRERQIDPYNAEAELLIRRHLETVRPDVIHVHHWLLLTNNIVSLAAQLGIPAIVTLHDLYATCARIDRQHRLGHFCEEPPSPSLCSSCAERQPWQSDAEVQQAIKLRQEQFSTELSLARLLLVPSESHRQFLSNLMAISPERLRVVPNGSIVRLSPQRDSGRSRFPHRPLSLAYWGDLTHYKGVHLLLEAVKQIKDPTAVEICLAGGAPDASYLEFLKKLAEGLSVTFTGEYQPEDLVNLDADMAVFPSLAYESYGFVLDEAVQLRLPVIVSDRGALASRAGGVALSFSAGDASALTLRIQEILDTPSVLEDMRQKLPPLLSPSMAEHAQTLETLYQEAIQIPSERSASVSPATSHRLAYFQNLVANRDQEIRHMNTDLEQRRVALEQQEGALAQQQRELREKEEEIRQREEELRRVKDEVSRLGRRLEEEKVRTQTLEEWEHKVSSSLGWRLLQRYYYLRGQIAPPGTRRGDFYELIKRPGVAYVGGGLASAANALKKAHGRLRRLIMPDPYELWLAQNALSPEKIRQLGDEVKALAYQPMISIVMPVYNTKETWLRQAIESVQSQIYPNWELCICNDGSAASHVSRILDDYCSLGERIRVQTTPQNRGISAASNAALSAATGEFVGFVDHDDELAPDALCEVVRLLNERPDLDLIYTDEDKLTVDSRRVEPFFKPDWSPDLFLSMNYIAHFVVVRRSILRGINGFSEGLEGSQDYDLILRISEKTQRIGHIARPLYSWRKTPDSTARSTDAKPYAHAAGRKALQKHLQRSGIAAEVVDGLVTPLRYRVRYMIDGQPLVSIIIPTRDRVDLLKRCLKSIEEKTTYRHFEIIIVDNQSQEPETLSYLACSPHAVVSVPGPFNYSYINNIGAAHAQGEYLLFLNNDTEVITEEWLAAMLEHAQHPSVGVVGAKLLYPNGTIQHAGVVLGHAGMAGHAFWYLPADDPGYFDLAQVVRNCSAVTAACMMMRKSVFAEVGGFDDNIKVALNDIDLCLRVREKGYLVIYTPYAVLYHLESATRKRFHPAGDEQYVRERWRSVIDAGDPYYNPHLSLKRFDFSLRILDARLSDSLSGSQEIKFGRSVESYPRKMLSPNVRSQAADTLEHRSNYKATWQHLSSTFDHAKMAVAGYTDEDELDRSGSHTVEVLDRLVGIHPSDIVLEIGCGVGRVGKLVSPKCLKWIGADISRSMLQYAAKRLKGLENVELLELSTVGLVEVPDDSIDVVYSTVVFMHLYEWDRYRYVLEAFRILRPGGRCFFDNVDITSDHGWKVFMEGCSFDINRRPAHLSMASTGEEMQTYALRAGLRDVKVHRWDDAWVGVTGIK